MSGIGIYDPLPIGPETTHDLVRRRSHGKGACHTLSSRHHLRANQCWLPLSLRGDRHLQSLRGRLVRRPTTLKSGLVSDALGISLCQRRSDEMIYHSNQRSRYASVAFGKRSIRYSSGKRPLSVTAKLPNRARASSSAWNTDCFIEGIFPRRPRLDYPRSNTSKASTIHGNAPLLSDTFHQLTTTGVKESSLN